MTDSIVRFVLQLKVPAGSQEAVKEVLEKLIKKSSNEPGTLAYEWFFSEDGSALFGHEWYSDSDAALAHMAGGGEDIGRLFELTSVEKVDVYGNISDELREAGAPFKPMIVPYWAGFTRL